MQQYGIVYGFILGSNMNFVLKRQDHHVVGLRSGVVAPTVSTSLEDDPPVTTSTRDGYTLAMPEYDVGFVGTGPDPDDPKWGTSAAMAYRHAAAYAERPDCRLVACTDLVEEHATAFAKRYDLPDGSVFTDVERMLEALEPDVVSVCTPVPTHAEIVTDCARHGAVRAIHCEKPMAHTMGASRRMVDVCEEAGVQLTFNHQRRVSTPTRRLSNLIGSGAVGEVERVELSSRNLFDAGTHVIDLCNAILDDPEPAWALAALSYTEEDVRYGVHNENWAFARWQYANGVDAVAATGDDLYEADLRVVGSDGEALLNPPGNAQIKLKRGATEPWESIETGEPLADVPAAISDVIRGVTTDREPALSARRALLASGIIFGCYESVRSRGRVSLPPDVDDNPLVAMVEAGDLSPVQSGDR